jgi:hypothetical protein
MRPNFGGLAIPSRAACASLRYAPSAAGIATYRSLAAAALFGAKRKEVC